MKIRPERVAGIVALSYLVLIPVAGAVVWEKIKDIDADVSEMWLQQDMPLQKRPGLLTRLKRALS